MSGKPWEYDPKVVPLPWRSQEEEAIKSKLHSGGLTLGYLNSDGIVSYYVNIDPGSVLTGL